jgi:NADPH:quinone reductase-like Zn-dependent oxidoreductase
VLWLGRSKGGRYHADDEEGGPCGGSLAEYIRVPVSSLVKVPKGMSPETAAALSMVCQTAYQGLFDYNSIKSGDKVIIFGGTTAVGQIAIQLAKNMRCNVFATCSTGKIDFVKALGATPIDYTKQSWWEAEKGFDAGFCTTIGDSDAAHLKDDGAFKPGAILSSILTAGPATEEGTPKVVKFVFHQDAKALQQMVDDAAAGKLKIEINKTWKGLTAENLKEMFTEQKTAKSLGKNVLVL